MAVINRTKDSSEKREAIHWRQQLALTTGETGVISYIPYPCVLRAANVGCLDNPAGAANIFLTVNRFIVGTGATVFAVGSTFVPPIFGTSGSIAAGISLPATQNLMAGDVLGYQVGGGSSAYISGMAGAFVIEAVQDAKAFLGGLA